MRSSLPRVLVILLTATLVVAGALLLGFAGALQFLAPEIPPAKSNVVAAVPFHSVGSSYVDGAAIKPTT